MDPLDVWVYITYLKIRNVFAVQKSNVFFGNSFFFCHSKSQEGIIHSVSWNNIRRPLAARDKTEGCCAQMWSKLFPLKRAQWQQQQREGKDEKSSSHDFLVS